MFLIRCYLCTLTFSGAAHKILMYISVNWAITKYALLQYFILHRNAEYNCVTCFEQPNFYASPKNKS
jgi:hypothetical protein